ncbi:MAG: glycosyltransferase family 4 protein [Clostridia bacterium]|nr:glycosyltransferase family 4 protein [Clostridia bacterium]
MKLLVVCQYYCPENFQVTPICESLAADGYDVTVLTGLPNYPEGTVPKEYRRGRRDEIINGVRVIRTAEIGRGRNPVRLALNYFSYCISASLKLPKLDKDFDAVFVYQLSPVLMGVPGRKYAKKHGVPMLIYCCDLWPESLKMYIKNESGPAFRIIRRISRSVYTAAKRIIVQSKSFIPYLNSVHGIPEERMRYLPAFADESYMDMDFTPEGDTTDFVFLGNLGIAQNLLEVLEAVDLIRDVPGFKVHFVGEGTRLEDMKRFVSKRGLEDKVIFYGRRPAEEMPRFYKLADACLVSLRSDNFTGTTLPAKVQGYMMAGKPVIGMIDGSTREVIESSGCGVCVGAGDVKGLAAAMKEFIKNRERFASCGKNAREYAKQNFRKEFFIRSLEEELENLKEE